MKQQPTWLELSNMTDRELADLWVEWDAHCAELAVGRGPGWKEYDQAVKVRDQVMRYAGQRLIERQLSRGAPLPSPSPFPSSKPS